MQLPNQQNKKNREAYEVFITRDYKKAINFYQELTEANPEIRSNYWYLGLCLFLNDEIDEASACWLTASLLAGESEDKTWTEELMEVIEQEAQRREILRESNQVIKLRQKIQELSPENFDNELKLNQFLITQYLSQNYYNSSFDLTIEDLSVLPRVNEIRSETSLGERRFLYKFFSNIWSGENNVLEIGPFLGGTTRAIALGMLSNPKRKNESKLYTYDRFEFYYEPEQLITSLQGFFDNNILDQKDKDYILATGNFYEAFQKIHNNHDYSDLIIAEKGALPQSKNDLDKPDLLKINNDNKFEVFFVDGCKGWYSTKYFMIEASQASEVGSYFIFQDYSWHTCFWIPCFLEIMKDYFQLLFYVDNTYTFILKKPLTESIIDNRYPEQPHDFTINDLNNIFYNLEMKAAQRKDVSAVIKHKLQHGASLAYIGHYDLAKKMIKSLLNAPYSKGAESFIYRSLVSPTYLPDGEKNIAIYL